METVPIFGVYERKNLVHEHQITLNLTLHTYPFLRYITKKWVHFYVSERKTVTLINVNDPLQERYVTFLERYLACWDTSDIMIGAPPNSGEACRIYKVV